MRSEHDTDGQQVEAMLRPLIVEHGIETVQAHLATLYGKARHSDYMRVAALARNVSNQIQRKEPK